MQYVQLITGTVVHYFFEDSFEHANSNELEIKEAYINTAVGEVKATNLLIPRHQIVMRWEQ